MTWTTRPRSEGPGGLHCWSTGTGPALVLIHGVGLRAEAWGAMVPLLAAQFTVHAVDMPGHGGSPLNDTRTLADYTARLGQFIHALGTPAHVAGHSMGAMIALDLALRQPTLVTSVAALNAIFERGADAARAVQSRAAALTQSGVSDPTPTLERWFGAAPTGPLHAAATACRNWLTSVDPQGYATAYTVFAHHTGPDRAALQELHAPALFLTGADDPNSTPDMSRAMAGLAPLGHAQVVQGAAHMAPMSHPTDIANALILNARRATP